MRRNSLPSGSGAGGTPGSVYPPTYLSLSSCLFTDLFTIFISLSSIYHLLSTTYVTVYLSIQSSSLYHLQPSNHHPEVQRTFQSSSLSCSDGLTFHLNGSFFSICRDQTEPSVPRLP